MPIVDFYLERRADAQGRFIETIWGWAPERLERVHDYIQWLFPLPEPSAFNARAPLLDEATQRAFRESLDLRVRLLRSYDLMLAFYGLRRAQQGDAAVAVEPAATFASHRAWLGAGNHNHLRLTRILKSARLLGLEAESRALFDCLERIAQTERTGISATTRRYWAAASASGD